MHTNKVKVYSLLAERLLVSAVSHLKFRIFATWYVVPIRKITNFPCFDFFLSLYEMVCIAKVQFCINASNALINKSICTQV